MSGRVGRVMDAFRGRAGRDPDGVWAAPGRGNLIGEHTDYNDGFVLPLAIDRLVLVAAGRRGSGRLRLWSLQTAEPADLELAEVGPGRVGGWAAYPAGVAWALVQAGVDVGGADLVVDGDVPAGAGLSSSAALECATATALADLHGAGLDRVALAGVARRAENEVVGVPSGVMDQMVSMLGRAGHALFLDTRSLGTEQVPLPLEAAGLCLLVLDTRARHRLVDGAYADRRAACEATAAALGVPAAAQLTVRDGGLVLAGDTFAVQAVPVPHRVRVVLPGLPAHRVLSGHRGVLEVAAPPLPTAVVPRGGVDGRAVGRRDVDEHGGEQDQGGGQDDEHSAGG